MRAVRARRGGGNGGVERWSRPWRRITAAPSWTDEGGADALREEISAAHNERQPIRLFGEDVPWAEFNALEALCQRLGLAFKRESSPIGDGGYMLSFYPGVDHDGDGHRAEDFDTTSDFDPVLRVDEIRRLIAEGRLADELDRLDEIRKFERPLILEGSMAEEATPRQATQGTTAPAAGH